MYTANDLTRILGVTRQTAYRYLKKYSEYVVLLDGVKHLTEDGFKLLQANLNGDMEFIDPIHDEIKHNGYLELLKAKDEQIKAKDEQIKNLLQIIDGQNERHKELNLLLAQYVKKDQLSLMHEKEHEEKPLTFLQKVKNLFT